MTKEELFSLRSRKIDFEVEKRTQKRWDSISKPLDGLGDFEKLITEVSGILGQEKIEKFNKALVVFCADNGIVEEGVSQCGQENTYLVAKLLGEGKSTASTMASFVGTKCVPVDVGINCDDELPGVLNKKVAKGTKNFLKEKACSKEEILKAIESGIDIIADLKAEDINLIATGEMGIGNTTTGTALMCALTGVAVEEVVGRGAGLSDEGLARKTKVIKQGLEKHRLTSPRKDGEYALEALAAVGGLDIAAMTGMYIGGAVYGVPIVIDGVISAVAALAASMIMPESKAYMIPSHAGRERGTAHILNRLGLKPYINGDMALGEGTGALMAFPLFDMALDFFNRAGTFDEGNIESYMRNL